MLMTVVLDCPDARRLAGFYSSLLNLEIKYDSEDWVTLDGEGDSELAFQTIADYRPPTWPSSEVPQMAHLDFYVADLPSANHQAVSLGARVLDDSHKNFIVYADPEGHPFCLCLS